MGLDNSTSEVLETTVERESSSMTAISKSTITITVDMEILFRLEVAFKKTASSV